MHIHRQNIYYDKYNQFFNFWTVSVSVPMLQHAAGSSLPSTQGHTVVHHGQSEQGHTQIHSVTFGPLPLISVAKQYVNPFYLKKLTGNIRVVEEVCN